MENLLEKLNVIFEVDELDLNLRFVDYEEWDSLSSLSIIALLDSDYGITFTNADILNFPTIGDFCNYVIANGK